MTTYKLFAILFLSTFVTFQYAFGQSEIYGEWEVFCSLELVEGSATKYCDLCESEISSNKMLDKIIYGFELKIEKDTIYLKNSKGTKSIKYNWVTKNRTINFDYNNKPYAFISLGTGSQNTIIFKDKDCLLLTLTKKTKP